MQTVVESPHDSRTKLLESALYVIRARGYSAARVEDICEVAGLTKGSFFHHFSSKEDLALAAARFHHQTLSFSIATTGLHTIEFLGTAPGTANSTAFMDRVGVTALGAESMRLRIGDAYQTINTTGLNPGPGVAGTTYAGADPLPTFTSAAHELRNLQRD